MYTYKALVTKVYDGDTITVDIDLGFFITNKDVSIRFYGINAPEVKGDTREAGLKSRDFVRAYLPIGKEVTVKTFMDKTEKYGRYLGEIILDDGRILNQMIVEAGLAVVNFYDLEH